MSKPATSAPTRRVLGPAVRALRIATGIKQGDLALRCDITPAYLNNIEAGRKQPASAVTVAIARELGVPLDAITYTTESAAA